MLHLVVYTEAYQAGCMKVKQPVEYMDTVEKSPDKVLKV